MGRCTGRLLAATLGGLAAMAAAPPSARGQTPEPADTAADAAPPADAPGVPSGPSIDLGSRPPDGATARACSFTLPLCVHASAPGTPVLDALASAERAWGLLTGALSLPSPDVDLGTGALDLYLVDHEPSVARAVLYRRDAVSAFDRASAFVLLDGGARGCDRDAAIARELARASLWRTAPATDAATAAAETAYLARVMVPCAMGMIDGVDRFQQHPEQAIADGLDGGAGGDERARGAALFYWWLDYSFGTEPGATVRALWALAPTRTPLGAARWKGTPNGVDVLRTSFKNALRTGSTIDDLWVNFAVARAFVGSADDGAHLPESRAIGAAGLVRTQWDIGWPAHARSLASGSGVAPTGAAFIAIAHAGAPPGARLRVEATWEEHAKMRWAVVRLDAAGKELGHVEIPAAERATEAQMTVVDLEGVARILVVGTNAGDPSFRFDPNDEVWEPHGWTVTVASE